MNQTRSAFLNRLVLRMRPTPIPPSQQPAAVVVMAAALLVACGFAYSAAPTTVFFLPVATAFAIGYRWRVIACLQLLMLVLFARDVSFSISGAPLQVSGGIFLPSILLPYLTLHWLTGLEWMDKSNSPNQPETRRESFILTPLFGSVLFVLTILCLHTVDRALVFGSYYKLEPEGVTLIVLVLILAAGFVLAYGSLNYYRSASSDQRIMRLQLHHVLHKCCRKEERILFRKRSANNRKQVST